MQKPTPDEMKAIDRLSRAMEPEAWAEFDAGDGTCTNMAGGKCIASIETAKRLIRAFPAVVGVVLATG